MQKTISTIAGVTLSAIATTAVASEARIAALGNDRSYLVDVRNIYTYPTEVRDNPDAVLVELGTLGSTATGDPNDPELGGIWHANNAYTFAANLNRKHALVTSIVDDPDLPSSFYSDVKNSFDLIGAMDAGATKFAAHLYYGSGIDDHYTSSSADLETSVLRVTVGAAFNFGSDMAVETSLFVDDFSLEHTTAVGKVSTESDGIFGFNVRAMKTLSANLTFLPSVTFQTGELKANALGSTSSANQDFLAVKAGMNYHRDSLLLAGGIAFEDYDAGGVKTAGLPLKANVGLESLIYKDWLYGRLGAQKYISGTEKTASTERSLTVSDADFLSAGLGMKMGSFSADAVIYESNLYSGTGLLSNVSSNLVGQISMEYQFR